MTYRNSIPDAPTVNAAQHLVRECLDIARDIARHDKMPYEQHPVILVGLAIAIIQALRLMRASK